MRYTARGTFTRELRHQSSARVLASGLKQAGVRWEELVEMLQGLNMNLTLVRTCGLVPFDAHDVRNDIS